MDKGKRARPKSPLKSKPLRNPGQSLDERINRLLNDKLYTRVIFLTTIWVLAWIEWLAQVRGVPRMPGWYAACAAVLTLSMAPGIWSLVRETKRLKLGRDGERVVAEQLDVLKQDGASLFHDIPGDGFNLDHVVVSSKGIFAVETKTITKPHGKAKIVFDGSKVFAEGRELDRNPADQVFAQVTWLRDILKKSTGKDFYVRGALVFPGWWTESTAQAKNSQLWVLEPKALPKWIKNEPQRLADEEVRMASFHLRQYMELRA